MNDNMWPVKRIEKCSFNTKSKRFDFTAIWDCPGEEDSKEPLECFMECPLIVLEFEKRQMKEFRDKWQKLKIDNTRGMRKMPIVLKSVLKVVVPNEYVPSGREYLIKIYSRRKKNDKEVYKVRFARMEVPVIVRLVFLEYYFPARLIMFWREQGMNGPMP